MEQKKILNLIGDSEEIIKLLDNLGILHQLTKHYLLIAEEITEDGFTFLQPLKEHRDSYEHLMRVFVLSSKDDVAPNFDYYNYIKSNINKAFGHEYRAFFDTADWLTYTCRKFLYEKLSRITIRKAYKSKYSDYDEVRDFINEVSFTIATYREKKDVVSDTNLLSDVYEYKKTLDSLLDLYTKVSKLCYK